MADPFSAPAIALTCVGLAGKMADSIGRFVVNAKALPSSIEEFNITISGLHQALRRIQSELRKTCSKQPYEVEHRQDIFRILQSCKACLETLNKTLPELSDNPNFFEKCRKNLTMYLREGVIQGTLSHVRSYTQVLQLSLHTLSLGSMRAQQKSQEHIESEIRKLTDAIRAANLVPRHPVYGRRPSAGWEDDTQFEDKESLAQEIQAWKTSADDVATGVTLSELDRSASNVSLNTVLSKQPASSKKSCLSVSEYGESVLEDPDPEPTRKSGPGKEILELQYKANQDIVNHLYKCGIFLRASFYQKKGIALRETLSEPGHDVAFPHDDRVAMEEKHADILLSCETVEGTVEAKDKIIELLKLETARPDDEKDIERRGRLYHKLGKLYLGLDDLSRAKRYLERALEDRKTTQLTVAESVKETAALLVRVLQLAQEFDEARGLEEWVRGNLGREPDEPPTSCGPVVGPQSLSNLYAWCQENGFDIEREGFRLDACNVETRTSPLHLAVQEEKLEILKQMVEYGANLEIGSQIGLATPLLLAASTRNRHIVKILLNGGACADVRDGVGMSPLHRCQSKEKGKETAKLLLDNQPRLIDSTDNSGKTALFMACEMGNERMAAFLLDRGANPNICQQTQGGSLSDMGNVCTPLIAAIEAVGGNSRKIGMIEKLLLGGADPTLQDVDGRTAFDVARNAGLGASEIMELLKGSFYRKSSALSDSSTNTSRSYPSNTSVPRTRFLSKFWSRTDSHRSSSESIPTLDFEH